MKRKRGGDAQRADIERGIWKPPVPADEAPKPLLLRDVARTALAERDLAPRSREHAETLLRPHVDPVLGDLPVTDITPAVIGQWYANLLRDRTGQRDARTCTARWPRS